MKDYVVIWPHTGDKNYVADDIRRARPNEVAHLVANGTLVEKGKAKPAKKKAPANKAASAPANKSQGNAPANKGSVTVEAKTAAPAKPKAKRGLFGRNKKG